ncbi:hypothetical protein [Sulfolobus sp. E11-6]|uniref:hypothetical protein n=1 Tax=Sulfolobus sp. E11-6 TaxID=2663020 RepID=UPI0012960B68|nr:hypothetical protein [Sulfolobus sp. E11-6]QGA69601.1 hypothetical protein GFS33_13710 [Sulfolobus sp. E11-6]
MELFGDTVEKVVNFYPKISILEEVVSECDYFRIVKNEQGYLAYCSVLRRILTISQTNNCAQFWSKCPMRVLAHGL